MTTTQGGTWASRRIEPGAAFTAIQRDSAADGGVRGRALHSRRGTDTDNDHHHHHHHHHHQHHHRRGMPKARSVSPLLPRRRDAALSTADANSDSRQDGMRRGKRGHVRSKSKDDSSHSHQHHQQRKAGVLGGSDGQGHGDIALRWRCLSSTLDGTAPPPIAHAASCCVAHRTLYVFGGQLGCVCVCLSVFMSASACVCVCLCLCVCA